MDSESLVSLDLESMVFLVAVNDSGPQVVQVDGVGRWVRMRQAVPGLFGCDVHLPADKTLVYALGVIELAELCQQLSHVRQCCGLSCV